VRGPTNIIKLRPPTPFTGRQIEIFKVINYIKDATVKMINVYGPSGIGKTRFLIETAYFMHTRHDFHDGIFLIDVQKVLTFE
jgi:ABC-type lipoprotein export system ATPase subunit